MYAVAKNPSDKRKWTEEEVRQWYRETGAVTYDNPEDLNVVVPGPRGNQLTVNWANAKAYLLVAVLLAVVLMLFFVKYL